MPAESDNLFARFLASFEPPESKRLAHWVKLHENFTYSPSEFYALVQKNLAERKMDRLKLDFAALRERGILSAQRVYLCVRRERLLYVICAAPFGNGYLVSSRLIDQRRTANPLHYLGAAILIALFYAAIWRDFGWVWGVVATGFIVNVLWSTMRVAVTSAGEWLDENLPAVPIVGPIYETWFNPDTFHRQDQTDAYQQAVHSAVMQSVNEMTASKGIRPLTPDEARPVLKGLHNR